MTSSKQIRPQKNIVRILPNISLTWRHAGPSRATGTSDTVFTIFLINASFFGGGGALKRERTLNRVDPVSIPED